MKFSNFTSILSISVTLFGLLHLTGSNYRGYRETCGTLTHGRSRETVGASRQCNSNRGLTCTHQRICDCLRFQDSKPIWNGTYCVVKLNGTCRVKTSSVPELLLLPNVTLTEEILFCGLGAMCTPSDGCVCEEGLVPDKQKVGCIADDSSRGSSFQYKKIEIVTDVKLFVLFYILTKVLS